MPYKIVCDNGGYTVIVNKTKRKLSLKPLTKSKAIKQLRAVYANENKKK